MGFVGGLLGTKGGAGGTGFSGPGQSNIMSPTTADQATAAYNQTQGGLDQQQQFLQALQAQQGLANQSNVYNQLQGVASGTGPNPAQAQLAQATGANVANQAALMASQRGAGANVGLIGRQAAMQGANTQQQAAGQAATLQANQSLNALNQMGGLATNQVANQAAATNAYSQAAQGQQSNILGAIGAQNQAQVGSQGSVNSANAGLAQTTMQGQNNLLGGVTSGIGAAFGLAEGGIVPQFADGGSVYQDTSGPDPFANAPRAVMAGPAAPTVAQATAAVPKGPQSSFGKFLSSAGASLMPEQQPGSQVTGTAAAGQAIGKGIGKGLNALFGSSAPSTGLMAGGADSVSDLGGIGMMAANGGKVPAMVSPGEQYLPPQDAKKVAQGKAKPLDTGERIPGKPKVKGNSYTNDTVPKTLESGGVVIPNSIMQAKDAEKKAAAFVKAVLAKNALKKGK